MSDEYTLFLVHKFAFGVLGWKPYDYYCSSPYEFFCACEGYFDRLEHQAQIARLASHRIHETLSNKPLKIHEYWPLFSDKIKSSRNEKIVIDDDITKQILAAHNIEI